MEGKQTPGGRNWGNDEGSWRAERGKGSRGRALKWMTDTKKKTRKDSRREEENPRLFEGVERKASEAEEWRKIYVRGGTYTLNERKMEGKKRITEENDYTFVGKELYEKELKNDGNLKWEICAQCGWKNKWKSRTRYTIGFSALKPVFRWRIIQTLPLLIECHRLSSQNDKHWTVNFRKNEETKRIHSGDNYTRIVT